MFNIKKGAIASLLVLSPIFAHASGINLYLVANSTVQEADVENTFGQTVDQTYEQTSAGLGFAFKTNVNKESMLGYHVNLEYLTGTVHQIDSASYSGDDIETTRWNMLHTLAFGIVKKPRFRVWAGPRINLSLEHTDFNLPSVKGNTIDTFSLGIAPAVGGVFKIGRKFAITADLDYRIGVGAGSWYSAANGTDYDYSHSETGLSFRLGADFVFGESR